MTTESKTVSLLPSQEMFWMMQNMGFMDTEKDVFLKVAVHYRIFGALEPLAINKALSETVAAHDALRASIVMVSGSPRNLIRDEVALPVELLDLSGRPADRMQAAMAAVDAHHYHPILISAPTPLSALLIRIDSEDHILSLVGSHMMLDGRAMGLIMEEVRDRINAVQPPEEPAISLAGMVDLFKEASSASDRQADTLEVGRVLQALRPMTMASPSRKSVSDRLAGVAANAIKTRTSHRAIRSVARVQSMPSGVARVSKRIARPKQTDDERHVTRNVVVRHSFTLEQTLVADAAKSCRVTAPMLLASVTLGGIGAWLRCDTGFAAYIMGGRTSAELRNAVAPIANFSMLTTDLREKTLRDVCSQVRQQTVPLIRKHGWSARVSLKELAAAAPADLAQAASVMLQPGSFVPWLNIDPGSEYMSTDASAESLRWENLEDIGAAMERMFSAERLAEGGFLDRPVSLTLASLAFYPTEDGYGGYFTLITPRSWESEAQRFLDGFPAFAREALEHPDEQTTAMWTH